mmetsp:Transcript_69996/g.221797  ORF Transcript_69996/g.221797 Transcript_69996/m.221797 type:complete len:117 (-) Transcript_69996:1360-1710(-)
MIVMESMAATFLPIISAFSGSCAEVGSSITRIGASRRRARAMQIRCCCPPERRTPWYPTSESYPCSLWMTSSCTPAIIAAAFIASSSVSCSMPIIMLSRMEPENSLLSCSTVETVE